MGTIATATTTLKSGTRLSGFTNDDGESESLPQSDNPEVMALIESAFEYEKSQGGAPVSESECGAHETI